MSTQPKPMAPWDYPFYWINCLPLPRWARRCLIVLALPFWMIAMLILWIIATPFLIVYLFVWVWIWGWISQAEWFERAWHPPDKPSRPG